LIYRFLGIEPPKTKEQLKLDEIWDKEFETLYDVPPEPPGIKNRRCGGAWQFATLDMPPELRAPRKSFSKKAKFYFTEAGYKLAKEYIQKSAIKWNFELRVIKRKNPKKSQIVFQDKYQVAILEDKRT